MIQWTFTGRDPGRHPPDITYCGSSDASTVQEMERDLVAFWTTLVEAFTTGLLITGLSPWNSVVLELEDDLGEVRAHSAMNGEVVTNHAIYVGVCFNPPGLPGRWLDGPTDRTLDLHLFDHLEWVERQHAAQMAHFQMALLNAAASEEASSALLRLQRRAGDLRFYILRDRCIPNVIPLNFRLGP